MKDLESVAFGVANAGSTILAEYMVAGTLTSQKVVDTAQSCVDTVRAHTGVSFSEAEAALDRAFARIKDRNCN